MPPAVPRQPQQPQAAPTGDDAKSKTQSCPWCEAPIPAIGADGKISDADKAAYHAACWQYMQMVMKRFGLSSEE